MKVKKVISTIDSFIDYEGKERKFVMAVVSAEDTAIDLEPQVKLDEDVYVAVATGYPYKFLSVGVSVCMQGDKFNPEQGLDIAIGKALKRGDHLLETEQFGLIGDEVANALLNQECKFFRTHPDTYIAGYAKRANEYRESKKLANKQ